MKRKTLIVIIIGSLGFAGAFIGYQYNALRQPGITILLYHKVSENAGNSGNRDKYTISLSKFRKHLEYLYRQGYSTILPKDIFRESGKYKRSKNIIISFDVGTEDHYSIVYPTLSEKKMRGIFFIITKYIGRRGMVTSRQIVEMSKNGMEIGSHSYSHPFLDELDFSEIYLELEKSKVCLEKLIGQDVLCFAPPGGWFNDKVVNISRRLGYKAILGCEIGINDLEERPFIYKRIEILGDISLEEFKKVLKPSTLIGYKIRQTIKFIIHDMLGSKNYNWLKSLVY